MKKLAFWTAGGLSIATVCGLVGLPHLSATLVTLTVFCALQVLADWSFGVVWSLPDRIAAWVEPAANVSAKGKREGGA
ncbi:hypothetical protein O9X99_05105 [Agrobacterium salinitolerans]|uniref:Uncharacterized protein n=1 Tax=Agrobacterium salinitolerans TaxID=1183413 RepID=A0ABY3BRA3_9HYPH|nr:MULTISPECIES: hypothetical protein [Agrobacterium]MCZ7891041.1 hypothetical protein [Agrobacterium salinitolerans]TRA93245.1 hypothetical protein EXN23_11220 [Agrobacterium salinitolerans]